MSVSYRKYLSMDEMNDNSLKHFPDIFAQNKLTWLQFFDNDIFAQLKNKEQHLVNNSFYTKMYDFVEQYMNFLDYKRKLLAQYCCLNYYYSNMNEQQRFLLEKIYKEHLSIHEVVILNNQKFDNKLTDRSYYRHTGTYFVKLGGPNYDSTMYSKTADKWYNKKKSHKH